MNENASFLNPLVPFNQHLYPFCPTMIDLFLLSVIPPFYCHIHYMLLIYMASTIVAPLSLYQLMKLSSLYFPSATSFIAPNAPKADRYPAT